MKKLLIKKMIRRKVENLKLKSVSLSDVWMLSWDVQTEPYSPELTFPIKMSLSDVWTFPSKNDVLLDRRKHVF